MLNWYEFHGISFFCCFKTLKIIMFIQTYKDHFIDFDEIFGLLL